MKAIHDASVQFPYRFFIKHGEFMNHEKST